MASQNIDNQVLVNHKIEKLTKPFFDCSLINKQTKIEIKNMSFNLNCSQKQLFLKNHKIEYKSSNLKINKGFAQELKILLK